ncbi:MAG: phage tail sheath subtilisin-like domain-containing protein [Candidatus Promineifilaceae bacterium]|nr:phage tail sheath subtilisin-like domain-containing protein [Candidatus Promineifilaceae bacterium]
MPEYLSPGVYIEETSFRTKTIEGVSTSTAGFIGPTRYGPVSGEPELLTSFADFQRIYGDLEDLDFTDQANPQVNYLAHGVRAFFEEGGSRLFVQRVFNAPAGFGITDGVPSTHYAQGSTRDGETTPEADFNLVARFPGAMGNMRVTFELQLGQNVFREDTNGENHHLTRLGNNALVHARTVDTSTDPDTITAVGTANGLMIARRNPVNDAWELYDGDPDAVGATPALDLAAGTTPPDGLQVRPLTVLVEASLPSTEPNTFLPAEVLGTYSFIDTARDALLNTFIPDPENRFEALTIPFAIVAITAPAAGESAAINLVTDLLGTTILDSLSSDTESTEVSYTLEGGDDGQLPTGPVYTGDSDFDDFSGDVLQMPLNGLLAFEQMEDISIVAGPGYTADRTQDQALGIHNALINHCERMQYRVAVLETPENQTVTEALNFRNLRSSTHAAIYYPWIFVADPRQGRGGRRLKLPPSGFVAGIYARNDRQDAVFKAPANEVVRLALDFEQLLNQAQQDLLNPNGVNCFRFFEGRGYLLWGARTISDDPEWKYVNVRRYFCYLERSIDRATQWVVFENNGPRLWDQVRLSVENFLYNEWKAGGLLGNKPEEAYFVRCDRSTMTQNDLDNGRLICLIGVAPVRPAEFVIFRIGQWTADAEQ